MINVKFLKPVAVVKKGRPDALDLVYPFVIRSGTKEVSSTVDFRMSGNIKIKYDLDFWQEHVIGYYDEFMVKMFPYVIDVVKENPYGKGLELRRKVEMMPTIAYKGIYDATQSIEGYELEVIS